MNYTIRDYGYTEFFEKQVDMLDANELIPARIIEVQKEQYKIYKEFDMKNAKLKGSKFYNNLSDVVFPAIGDFVLVKFNPDGDDIIHEVLTRQSKFSRIDMHYGKEQIVATNFDFVFIVASLNKDFKIKKIERYISIAWQSGGTPVIVLTKADICDNYLDFVYEAESAFAGVDVIPVSSISGFGFDALSKFIKPSKTIVLLGASGVGKSSLINAIAKDNIMKTNTIREDDSKGRHTTTHRQLVMLENKTMIIDTPGMRELGMWSDAEDGIDSMFSEIDDLILKCRFKDCAHNKEPGCAIKEAIKNGVLPIERWNNYLKLKKEAKLAMLKEQRRIKALEKMQERKKQSKTRTKSIEEYE